MNKIIVSIVFLFFAACASQKQTAQNISPNPYLGSDTLLFEDFEDRTKAIPAAPYYENQQHLRYYDYVTLAGKVPATTRWMSDTMPNFRYRTPANVLGFQYPLSGTSYTIMAMRDWTAVQNFNRKILIFPLVNKLQKDSLYEISYWVSFAEKTSDSCDRNFGFGFSSELLDTRNPRRFIDSLKNKTQLIQTEHNYCDTANWHQVAFTYKGRGNENFLYLGNFTPYSLEERNKNKSSFFYVEDVLVRRGNRR